MKKLHSVSILLRVSCCTYSSGIHFYFTWKDKGKTVIEYKILKYRKLKMISSILPSHRALLNSSFFWWRQIQINKLLTNLINNLNLLTNSDFLLRNLFSARLFNIKYFSVKHNLQKSDFAFPCIFLTMHHLMVGTLWAFVRFQIYFDSSVSFLYCSCMKDLFWSLYLSLNDAYVRL